MAMAISSRILLQLFLWMLVSFRPVISTISSEIVDDDLDVVLRSAEIARQNDPTTEKVLVTLVIFFDEFPQHIGYTISSADDENDVYSYITNGDFTEEQFREKLFETSIPLTPGESFVLRITDSRGDGLTGSGFYALYFGDEANPAHEIFQEHQFDSSSHQVTFTAERSDTESPTASPAPTYTPSPTHSPSTCFDTDHLDVDDESRDYTPNFMTAHSVMPGTKYCAPHRNYADCTNEVKEDCQWTFLGTSPQKGVCRVDPISTCIRNGNCVCNTEDFKGGDADMAEGLLFHVPVSVTSQDIGPYSTYSTHSERYKRSHMENEHHHAQDDGFFISRVDFTARKHTYALDDTSPVRAAPTRTVGFKLHYLYWDLPMKGLILDGLTLSVHIDTSSIVHTINVNGEDYRLPEQLKKWTCTSVVITETTIFAGENEIPRRLNSEQSLEVGNKIELGTFTGELFDVRVYKGTLSGAEVRELGSRCTHPEDTAALQYKRDIENPYYQYGCEPDFERLPADEGGPVPNDSKQTYGSTPFSTLWMKPRPSPFEANLYLDVKEGHFDEEHFFQQAKIQSYFWERYLFHMDMIGFNQAPYKSFDSSAQVPRFAESWWNNPCRWLHNFNTGWQFPIYGATLPKWTIDDSQGPDNPVFDLAYLYHNQPTWAGGMAFVAHEMFHGVQGHVGDSFRGSTSRWIAETAAEYAAELVFPGSGKIVAPLTMAPSYPLGMNWVRDKERGDHFFTQDLSLNQNVRGGQLYASWVLWWFLAEHAGLPYIVGQVYGMWRLNDAYTSGELLLVRELVENANMDFGDVWSIALAHIRTWDLPKYSDEYIAQELKDFEHYKNNQAFEDALPSDLDYEARKTAVFIDPHFGTQGKMVSGPRSLRPGPNGWNCLTINSISEPKFITIQLAWDHGMGFDATTTPEWLSAQQHGCDEDPRFFNSVVVAHNENTGQRRYWKMKGREPASITIAVGSNGKENVHIILVPTPPTDYVGGVYMLEENGWDDRMSPIPTYGYQYMVDMSDVPKAVTSPAGMENGIVKFDKATPGWWPAECTCMEKPQAPNNRCIFPSFDGVGVTPFPSEAPVTDLPTTSPTIAPTLTLAPSAAPTERPSIERSANPSTSPTTQPTRMPTPSPTESPTLKPTELPTLSPTRPPTPPPTKNPTPPPTFERSATPSVGETNDTSSCNPSGSDCKVRTDCCSKRCFYMRPTHDFGTCVS